MRREMQQLAALMQAAAAGEAWAAEDAPAFPEDRVVTQRILAPSRSILPALARPLGRRALARSWRWCEARAVRELRAVLPRFARARLPELDAGIRQIGGGRHAVCGIAAPASMAALILVEDGLAARVPWALIEGWAWRAGPEATTGGTPPPQPWVPGLTLRLAWPERPLWHITALDPAPLRGWGARLTA